MYKVPRMPILDIGSLLGKVVDPRCLTFSLVQALLYKMGNGRYSDLGPASGAPLAPYHTGLLWNRCFSSYCKIIPLCDYPTTPLIDSLEVPEGA